MLVDTHAHLYWEDYKEDFDEVIQHSLDAGVTTIINVGVDVEKSHEALKQVQETNWPSGMVAYSTVGIHPHEALKFGGLDGLERLEENIKQLEQIYKSNPQKVIAVGECGLDFLFDKQDSHVVPPSGTPRNDIKVLQRNLFQAQIDLAKKLNLPLIVHCRDNRSKNSGSTGSPPQETSSPSAWDEVLKMIGTHPTILHCYSGLSHTTNYILQTTLLLVSFAATITYPKNDYLRQAAKLLPLERIVLETDCPFLPPQSKRGQRNEPAAVLEIAQLIADIKGASLKEVANQTTTNVKTMLNII